MVGKYCKVVSGVNITLKAFQVHKRGFVYTNILYTENKRETQAPVNNKNNKELVYRC